MRNGLLKALCCAAAALAASAATHAVTLTPVDLPRPEGTRHYLLAVPDTATSPKRALVILLHGHGGSAAQLLGRERSAAPMSLWLRIADREGVLVAAPDGAVGRDGRRGWNDCRGDAANNPQVDDVGFVTDIIHREVAQHGADPSRVFVMGMSNGGMMALRLAIELGSTLAGFASVSASMAAHSACPVLNVPVSALIIAGTHDPLVPYAGGDVRLRSSHPRGAVIGVETAIATWRDTIGLPVEPASVTSLPHRDP
ncbi:MAG TPA: PHB depolymerase family esterase, partial [Albitalea sp.]|nr:PHB depolymerase family esterase [Albitalea sp.]